MNLSRPFFMVCFFYAAQKGELRHNLRGKEVSKMRCRKHNCGTGPERGGNSIYRGCEHHCRGGDCLCGAAVERVGVPDQLFAAGVM